MRLGSRVRCSDQFAGLGEDPDVEFVGEYEDALAAVASPRAMWWSRLLCRMVMTPWLTRSRRTRKWGSMIGAGNGVALGRAGGLGGCAPAEGAVWAPGVVVVAEPVEVGLQARSDRTRRWRASQS